MEFLTATATPEKDKEALESDKKKRSRNEHEDILPDEVSTDHLNERADSPELGDEFSPEQSQGVAYTAANGLADLSQLDMAAQYEPDFSQYNMDFKPEPVPTYANTSQTINPQYAAYSYQSQYPIAASAGNSAANL